MIGFLWIWNRQLPHPLKNMSHAGYDMLQAEPRQHNHNAAFCKLRISLSKGRLNWKWRSPLASVTYYNHICRGAVNANLSAGSRAGFTRRRQVTRNAMDGG